MSQNITSPERLNLLADAAEMYRTMIKIRLFEEMVDKQYAHGKAHGTIHLSAGQEAVAVGAGFAVNKGDYLLNHHRGHGHFMGSGADVLAVYEFIHKASKKSRTKKGPVNITPQPYQLGKCQCQLENPFLFAG